MIASKPGYNAMEYIMRQSFLSSLQRYAPSATLGLLVTLVLGKNGMAQTPETVQPNPARLTVRPQAMALGAQTAKAGLQTLDSLEDYFVYVPTSCVGTKRCPLVIFLHGGGGPSSVVIQQQSQLADKYGMILLAPQGMRDNPLKDALRGIPGVLGPGLLRGVWDAIAASMVDQLVMDPNVRWLVRKMPYDQDVKNIDVALKQVLRTYAVDTAKIALVGMSNGGGYSLFLGHNNLDLFSRIAPLSPARYFAGEGPQDTTTQFSFAGGIMESRYLRTALYGARSLEQEGHPVKRVLSLRDHVDRVEDFDFAWHWLHESWGMAGPPALTVVRISADSIPVLTTAVLTQMVTFWTSFRQEPDSVRMDARLAHQAEFILPIGEKMLSVSMVNMPALAVKYPSVIADLKSAGLTAQQYQAYRIALITAKGAKAAGPYIGTIAPNSVLAKNMELLDSHSDESQKLEQLGIWTTP